MNVRGYAQAKALVENPDLDEKALQAMGIDEESIALVFENIERRSNDGKRVGGT